MVYILLNILLLISLVGCALVLNFFIQKLCDLTDGASEEEAFYAARERGSKRKHRAHQRTGMPVSFTKQSKGDPKRGKVCKRKSIFTDSLVR